MPNKSGSVYGLTLLCPILDDPARSPFARSADPRLSRQAATRAG